MKINLENVGAVLQPIVHELARQIAEHLTQKSPLEASEANEFLNVEEAAKFLDVSKSTLYKKTSKKEIPFYKRGKQLRFKRTELTEWLEQGKQAIRATNVQSNLSFNF